MARPMEPPRDRVSDHAEVAAAIWQRQLEPTDARTRGGDEDELGRQVVRAVGLRTDLFEWHRSLDNQERHGQARPNSDSRNDEETFLQAQTEGVAVESVEKTVTYRGEGVACPADWADDAEA
jgi:hypothetical protein